MRFRDIIRTVKSKLVPTKPVKIDYDPTAWQRLDETWDNNFTLSGWTEYRLNIVDWVLSIQDDHQDMLDTGCHIGHFINALRERGYKNRYQGVDVTQQFIDRARVLMPAESYDLGDVRELVFPDKSFDLVMCVGVLMHLPDIKAPLAHVFRIARKYVILSTYGSREKTYTRHNAENRFMNSYYSKSDIMAEVPSDWELIEYKEFERTDIQRNNLIFQFLLQRRS